ncbi:MAG: protein translocase subunit SecD, partial [Synergistaceae bacterium]|nr:protein translocase subunit SecD [Synergistaceae bacterium]
RNYDDDEGYERAHERRNAALEAWDGVERRFAERAAAIDGTIVSRGDDDEPSFYLLGGVLVAGGELTDAVRTSDSWGRPAVSISFNSEGARAFAEATGRLVGKQLAIVLDGVTISAPVVNSHIRDGSAQITGRFNVDEAARFAIMLRAGALPVAVEIAENRSVGPSLGADSIRQGIQAGIAGTIAVLIFMLAYYRFNGLAADIALMVTVLLVFAGLIAFNATLTLPGIAGIILTIGMAVDGNVLINERIKEELKAGKTPLAALDAGFSRAFVTIMDSNITSLIAAVVLFFFGIGSVRGFGVTLSIGLVAGVFSNVVVTRAFLQIFMKQRQYALKQS